jgi:hypothetical protein
LRALKEFEDLPNQGSTSRSLAQWWSAWERNGWRRCHPNVRHENKLMGLRAHLSARIKTVTDTDVKPIVI